MGDYCCWRNVYDYDDLPDCVNKLGSEDATILVAYEIIISANLTVPENIMLLVIKGGAFYREAGVTLTINEYIDAGPFVIFKGPGNTVLGPKAAAYARPEWWEV
uniref:Uncharacterized protein n=1 Tax=viral metagenome TaxID=1070528 RepID=A0A6M3X578_9ZZZZ